MHGRLFDFSLDFRVVENFTGVAHCRLEEYTNTIYMRVGVVIFTSFPSRRAAGRQPSSRHLNVPFLFQMHLRCLLQIVRLVYDGPLRYSARPVVTDDCRFAVTIIDLSTSTSEATNRL